MDIASLIGILLGPVLVLWGITQSGKLSGFYDFGSILIVLGGTLSATLISYPLSYVVSVAKTLPKAFLYKAESPTEIIKIIVSFAEKARREGLLALENEAAQLQDEFLQKGIQLIVDGTDPELVRNILETELSFIEERHKNGWSVFETMASLAPAFGMIGTLIGLVNMLANLDDPSSLGPGMAVALITTFYGSVLANMFFTPIAGKLKVRSAEEVLIKQIMIEGILSVQAGENPRIVEEKMKAFLAPQLRQDLRGSRGEE